MRPRFEPTDMGDERTSVVYVLPDKLGGVASIVDNLLAYRRADGWAHRVLLTHNRLDVDTRYGAGFPADGCGVFEYTLPVENLRAVLARLGRALPPGPGVLVSNDWIELATLAVHDPGRTVIQLLHGDHEYYYDLAVKHEPLVHAWIAYSRAMYGRLRALLPHRAASIFHLPYGIPIPPAARAAAPGPLRLLYAGRLENGQKGIFDLPLIDTHLRELGAKVVWTVVGGGPDEGELRHRWNGAVNVRWLGRRGSAEVQALEAEHDVFVLPTRAEGFSVALLEAMAAGLVPVVSDIESGVPEVVEADVSGFRPAVGDIAGFARAIAELGSNRDRLEAMSHAARRTVVERFDARERVPQYQALYARFRELYRPRPADITLHYGSRLDQPWLPNRAVYAVRAARRRLAGKPLP
jgi:glycosyltransferase involved in cell wall biosynthesis